METDSKNCFEEKPGMIPLRFMEISAEKAIYFKCHGCGDCFRHDKGKIAFEPLDVYRLAKFLQARGQPNITMGDVLQQFGEPQAMTYNYPLYSLRTTGPDDSCVFYKITAAQFRRQSHGLAVCIRFFPSHQRTKSRTSRIAW